MAMTANRPPPRASASAGPSSSRFARAVSSLLSPFSSSLASSPNSSSRRSSSNSSLSPSERAERSRSVSDAGPKGGPSGGAGGGGRELGGEGDADLAKVGRKSSPWAAWASMVSLSLEPDEVKHSPPASTPTPPRDHTARLGADVSLRTTTRDTGRTLAASASARSLALEPDTSTGSSRVSTFTRLVRRRSTNVGVSARVGSNGGRRAAPPAAPPRIALEDFGFVRDGPPTPPLAPADLPRIELHLVDTALDLDMGEEFGKGTGH